MTALFVSTALASPGSFGAAHLGSEPISAGTAWAGTGAIVLWHTEGGTGGVGLEGGAALGGRAAVGLQLGTDFVEAAGVAAALAGRYLLVDDDGVHVAATWTSFVMPLRDGYQLDGWRTFTAHSPGIALDVGGQRVRFDLAVPIWGFTSYDRFFGLSRVPFPLYGTLGVDLLLAGGHRLRFGLPELFSWSWRGERAYVDLGGVTVVAAGAIWTKFGLTF